jgi:hypothetical protein
MSIRHIMTIALFMFLAFFSLRALAAPEWAVVLTVVAVGEFLWSREQRRMARDHDTARLHRMMTAQALMLEMKFPAAIEKLGRAAVESADAGAEREAEAKVHLI